MDGQQSASGELIVAAETGGLLQYVKVFLAVGPVSQHVQLGTGGDAAVPLAHACVLFRRGGAGRRGGWAAVPSSATGGQGLPNYLDRRDGTSPVFALAVPGVVVIGSSPCVLKVQFQERFDVVGQGPGLRIRVEMGNHIPRLVDGEWRQALPACSGLLILQF